MTDAPDSRATGDLNVLEAWQLLIKPAPTRRAASYACLSVTILLLNLSAIAAIVAATVADPNVAVVAVLLHTAIIPGLLLAFAVVPTSDVDLVEWLGLALGFGLLVLVLSGLGLALTPVRLVSMTVVIWTSTLTLGLSAAAFARGISWRPPSLGSQSDRIGAGLVVLAAACLRLPGLGYSEFQGDETEVILRATGVVQNLPDALFYHGKGPGEVVVVSTLYGLLGDLSEGAARLPFALAGIGGVLAFFLVTRRLIGLPGALAGGLLLAANGYFLAFSRITQYQSLVLLLGMLGLWCAVRWSQGGSNVWPVLAGVFVATAALAHYDALFFLPPIGLVALWRTGLRGLFNRSLLAPWRNGALAGIVILALFFVPYMDSPLFALATDRIGDRVGAGFPRNNVLSIVASATLYLGTAFPVLVGVLIVAGLVSLAVRLPGSPPLRIWLLGLAWAAVPLLFYAFVARKPGTHVHVATTGLLLLAGCGASSVWAACRRPVVRFALAGAFAASLGLAGAYLIPIYLQSAAEIVRENRVPALPLSWRPPGGLPTKERFGFPYQVGWKAVGALYADGTLDGSYDSNEQPQVTYWYTRGAWRCSAEPRYYVIAENVQDEIETPRRTISSDYHQIGMVTVAGQPKLRVFERGADRAASVVTWPAESLTPRFDIQVSAPRLDPGPWARGVMSREGSPLAVRFGQDVDLLGYQVYAEHPRPGGMVRVDLFWLPHVASNETHRIDVQLGDEPRVGDGSGPACDKTGNDRNWTAERPFVQRVSIPIAASARPGPYPLLVSVSRLADGGGPLPAAGGTARGGALVEIGQVEVRDGSQPGR